MDVHRRTLNPADRNNWRWKLDAWIQVVFNLWWVVALLIACAVLAVKSLS